MFDVSYQVDVRQEARWTTLAMWERESDARRQVDVLLRSNGVEGVRLNRLRISRRTGREYLTTLEEKLLEDRTPAVGVGRVDRAGLCETAEEFWLLPSRQVISKALRIWMDQEQVTTTELLCLPKLQKRLEQADGLMFSAIATVATAQAKATGAEVKPQVAALSRLVADTMKAARSLDVSSYPAIGEEGLSPLTDQVSKSVPIDSQGFVISALVARETSKRPSLSFKLERMMELARLEPNDLAVSAIDRMAADILASGQTIQEVLGEQPDLVSALSVLLDLAAGVADPEEPKNKTAEGPSLLTQLAEVTGTGIAREVRTVLIERVARELAGSQPLVRKGDGWAALRELLGKAYGQLKEGTTPDLAAGFVDRTARLLNKGGDVGLAEGIRQIGTLFDRDWDAVRFFLALAQSPKAAGQEAALRDAANDLVPMLSTPNTLLYWMDDRVQKRQALEGLRREVIAAGEILAERDLILVALAQALERC